MPELQHLLSDNVGSGHAGILPLSLPVYRHVALNLEKLANWHHSSLPSFPEEISFISLPFRSLLTSLPNPLHHSTNHSMEPLAGSEGKEIKPEASPGEVSPCANAEEIEKVKPGWRFLAGFTSIAFVNLACALDANIISVALPVSLASLPSLQVHLLASSSSSPSHLKAIQLKPFGCEPHSSSPLWSGSRTLLLCPTYGVVAPLFSWPSPSPRSAP